MKNEGRLSGKRWNRLLDHGLRFREKAKKSLTDAMMADGYPPFTVPLSPAEQYMRLVAMKDAGHPGFWEDPEAQSTYARLSARYGGVGPATNPLASGQYPGGGVV